MHKLLYIVRHAASLTPALIPSPSTPDREVTVLLIQEAVGLREVPGSSVYALTEDAAARRITPAYPTISYGDMVNLIFEADIVVAL